MVSLHNCSSSEHWHSGFVERIPARETGVNQALIPPANTCVCATGPLPSWCWTTSNSSLTSLWGVVTWATPSNRVPEGLSVLSQEKISRLVSRNRRLNVVNQENVHRSGWLEVGGGDWLRWSERQKRGEENLKMSNFYILLQGKQRAAKNSVGVCNQTSGVVKGERLACTGLPWQPPPSGIDMMVRKRRRKTGKWRK